MRTLVFLAALGAAAAAWPSVASADVNDAERGAARDLFKQGDELQRAGKFAEALDKFQRAEQVIQAPTNVLRVAECQAALGKLVEASESYRTVIRWTLQPGSPPAFQSAVDQAKGELAQVEPRVPKLIVQATPAQVQNAQLIVDGTAMPGALIGVPVPIDPGDHKILVSAPGYSAPELTVTLRERESKTVAVELKPFGGSATPPLPPPVATGTAAPPPPPPQYETTEPPAGEAPKPKKSTTSILLGAHLGLEIPSGKVPLPLGAGGVANPVSPVDIGNLSGPGIAFGLDGGLRFARQFYVGLSLERALLAGGKDASSLGASGVSSQTTSVGLIGAFIFNPDRFSLYLELGLQERWYGVSPSGGTTQNYSSGELLGGIGAWIPLGKYFRMIPLATVSGGSFSPPDSSGNATTNNPDGSHAFFMLGVDGFYNIEL